MALRDLIREIHRRSLWQVLLIYLGASWAVLEATDLIAERLMLPEWIPGLALVLLIIGFPIVLATAVVQEPAAQQRSASGAGPDPTGAPATSGSAGLRGLFTWRNSLRGGVFAFALWGVVAAGWLVLRPEVSGSEAPGARSIAVLPLQNMLGTDPEQEYFVGGLTDVLISELSKIGGLDVKSYTSVMRYQESERPAMPEIGSELGAEFLIEGSVAGGEDDVRVTIQLIEAAEDRHLWAESYRRPLADVLKLQEEVARAIAGEIQIRLDPETRARLAQAGSVDPEAAAAYVKGRYHPSTSAAPCSR